MLPNLQSFSRLRNLTRKFSSTNVARGKIRELEDFYEFDEEIKNKKILVYFDADWCGPCKFLTKDIGKIFMSNYLIGLNIVNYYY